MDIGIGSMLNTPSNIMTTVNTALLSMNLDTVDVMGDGLIKMMEQSVNPNLGQNIDIKL